MTLQKVDSKLHYVTVMKLILPHQHFYSIFISLNKIKLLYNSINNFKLNDIKKYAIIINVNITNFNYNETF